MSALGQKRNSPHTTVRWLLYPQCMAELVRNAQGLTMEEAGALIAQVQAPVGSLVEDVNGTRLIHADGIRVELLISGHAAALAEVAKLAG